MAIRTLLKYRNPDSTQDINDRIAGLFEKGVYSGGLLAPVPGALRVRLSPFSTVGSDGMFVKESSIVTIDVTADATSSVRNYIVINQQYVSNNDPIVSIESLTEEDFDNTGEPGAQGADNPNLIVFGVVTLEAGDVSVDTTDKIDYFERDSVDPLGRLEFRGLLDNVGDLPAPAANINRVGDFYIIADGVAEPLLYAWDGASWFNMTNAGAVAQDLTNHAASLNVDERHLTDEQAEALIGTETPPPVVPGDPSAANPYVTNNDPRMPTEDESKALAGNGIPLEDTLPSDTNRFVTSEKVFAAPEEKAFPITPTYIELSVTDNPDGYFVGFDTTALGWFNLYKEDTSDDSEYINNEFQAVNITDVKIGPPGGPPASSLNPSTNPKVDSLGFFIPDTSSQGSLFLITDNAVTDPIRASYGRRTYLGDLLPHLLMSRGPQGGQIDTNLARLLTGTPNAQFGGAIWDGSVAPGQLVGFNPTSSRFELADPNGILGAVITPLGIRGNSNNLIQEGLFTATSPLFSVEMLYADKANPGSLTNTPNEWFIGQAVSTTQLLVNMNAIPLEPSGEVVAPVSFPAILFDGSLQPGETCAFGSGGLFVQATTGDPTRLPLGIRGNSNNVLQSAKYTAGSGTPFIAGTRYYAGSTPGSLVDTPNDWYIGIATASDTLLVNSTGVATASKWEEEHEAVTGYHQFKAGTSVERAAISSPAVGMLFLRLDLDPPRIEFWNGTAWQDATSDRIDIPSGTKMLFVQDAVPVGWSLDISVNDKVIRVVDNQDSLDLGGDEGGSWSVSGFQADPHALTVAEMPAHQHEGIGESFGGWVFGQSATAGKSGIQGGLDNDNFYYNVSSVGDGDTHAHTVSNNGVWRPAYLNVIVCTKD